MATPKEKQLPYEDEVLRRMLQAPPKPHQEMKKKATAKKKAEKKRSAP